MRTLFTIMFTDGSKENQPAKNVEEAKILAQAKRIEQDRNYKIKGWSYSAFKMCSDNCDTCGRRHVCAD